MLASDLIVTVASCDVSSCCGLGTRFFAAILLSSLCYHVKEMKVNHSKQKQMFCRQFQSNLRCLYTMRIAKHAASPPDKGSGRRVRRLAAEEITKRAVVTVPFFCNALAKEAASMAAKI